MYRLGFTESTLLFYYYLDNYIANLNKNIYIDEQHKYLKWLFTTSGFYDKTINYNNYFNIINSFVYNIYFKKILDAIKNYNGPITFYFHPIDDKLKIYKINFFHYINKIDNCNTPRDHINYINREYVYNFIDNKNIIIINNLGILMKQQYYSGNLKKIYNDLPYVKNIDYIEPQYTFLNDGPDNSILETVETIYRKIDAKINNIDSFIISAGAYSILLANYIFSNYNKNILVIGGDLPSFFGINTKRGYMFYGDIMEQKKQYFINVPDNFKPPNYLKIEDGCYW